MAGPLSHVAPVFEPAYPVELALFVPTPQHGEGEHHCVYRTDGDVAVVVGYQPCGAASYHGCYRSGAEDDDSQLGRPVRVHGMGYPLHTRRTRC